MIQLVALALPAAVLIALVVRRYCWMTRICSWSMYPTFHHGDWVATRRLRGSTPIRRGEIVIIASAELGHSIIKRVIGLPGERIEVDARGVSIDGLDQVEPYVAAHGGTTGRFHVPMHAYMVLGDNRSWSSDSRSWVTPFVPVTAIRGRVAARPLIRRAPRAAPSVIRP